LGLQQGVKQGLLESTGCLQDDERRALGVQKLQEAIDAIGIILDGASLLSGE
jgi:hypothetical protein